MSRRRKHIHTEKNYANTVKCEVVSLGAGFTEAVFSLEYKLSQFFESVK